MPKIREVYPADMVAHLWANRHPHAIRTATGNMSAASGRLYSYGSHYVIGAFLDNPAKGGAALLLWNESGYSNTTNRHKSHASRALHGYQWQSRTIVPSMSDSSLRDLPALALDCIKAAVEPLEKAKKARQNRDGYLTTARRYFESAARLYAYAGKKAIVPTIPECPSNDEIDSVLRAINRAEYLKAGADYLARALELLASTENRAAMYDAGDIFAGSYARDICESAHGARQRFDRAADEYKKAGARIPAKIRAGQKTADAIGAKYAPAARLENLELTRRRVEETARAIRETLAGLHRAKKHGDRYVTLSSGRKIQRGSIRSLYYLLTEKAGGPFGFGPFAENTPVELWGDKAPAIVAELRALESKARRIVAAHAIRERVAEVADTCADYESRMASGANSWAIPASGTIKAALSDYMYANGGNIPAYFLALARPIIDRADSIRAGHEARAIKAAAERIDRWRAGENVTVPRDCPVMARIVGDTVETSWGAVVPLEHAARLVRIARRIAAGGGQKWERGTGPIVGHFRVDSIGADLSAIIGCHQFTAAEAMRAADAIDAATIGAVDHA